jgi:hypothetical protein
MLGTTTVPPVPPVHVAGETVYRSRARFIELSVLKLRNKLPWETSVMLMFETVRPKHEAPKSSGSSKYLMTFLIPSSVAVIVVRDHRGPV